MQTSEQQKKVKDFNQKIADLIKNESPEGYNVLLFGGSVDENNDREKSLQINAIALIIGSGKGLDALISSSIERDADIAKVLTRALKTHTHENGLEKILAEFRRSGQDPMRDALDHIFRKR